MNFKKIVSTIMLTGICLLPYAAQAQQIGQLKNMNDITAMDVFQSSNEAEVDYKFTDDQPVLPDVAPIENVEEYLPEKMYPSPINTGELLDLIAPRTDTFTVIDIETGKSFEAVRYGGNKHLDTEPKSKADTEVLNSLENQSWNRRAIAVYFNGEFYAASMHTMDHGNGFVSSNGFRGHICIHVLGSRTHGGNRVCDKHQGMVQKALSTDITTLAQSVSK